MNIEEIENLLHSLWLEEISHEFLTEKIILEFEKLQAENAELRDSVKNVAYALEAMTKERGVFAAQLAAIDNSWRDDDE